ncbi:MAG: HEAT repeat domain-containing protein [Vampirovibrionales bacterium]
MWSLFAKPAMPSVPFVFGVTAALQPLCNDVEGVCDNPLKDVLSQEVLHVPDAVPSCLWHNEFCLSVFNVLSVPLVAYQPVARHGICPNAVFPDALSACRVHQKTLNRRFGFNTMMGDMIDAIVKVLAGQRLSDYSFKRNVWSVLSSRSWSQDVQEFFQRWLSPALHLAQLSQTQAQASAPASPTLPLSAQEAEIALEHLFQRTSPLEPSQVKSLLEALDKTCQPYTSKGSELPPGLVLLLCELLEKAPHILLIQRAVHWANRLKLQASVEGLCLLFQPLQLSSKQVFTEAWGCGASQMFQTQRMALQTLGVLRNSRALNTLLEVVQNLSLDYRLRLAAADALGRLGHQEAASVLQHVASNPDENSMYVKESSIKALGLLGDLHAMTEIAGSLFAHQPSAERLIFLKETLLQSISQGHIHQLPDAMRAELQQVLETVLQDASATLRAAATHSVAELQLSDFIPLLKKRMLEETPDVAVAMVHALASFEEYEWLTACLTTHEESLPKKVAQAFRQVLQHESMPPEETP